MLSMVTLVISWGEGILDLTCPKTPSELLLALRDPFPLEVELYQKCGIYAGSCQVLVLLAPFLGAELGSGSCWSRGFALLAPEHGFAVGLALSSSPF